jgi:hypothetical protein
MAVIYQWESRKRTPSPVLWQRPEPGGRPAKMSTTAVHLLKAGRALRLT